MRYIESSGNLESSILGRVRRVNYSSNERLIRGLILESNDVKSIWKFSCVQKVNTIYANSAMIHDEMSKQS